MSSILYLIKQLLSGKVKEMEFNLSIDTDDNESEEHNDAPVYVEDSKLFIQKDKLEELAGEIKRNSMKKVIRIEPYVKECIALTDSKFGGYPYWPIDMEYPVNSEGVKLVLLAQINLSELQNNLSTGKDSSSELSLLPSTGLLQFLISCDDIMGLDDEKGYKVVYHKTIDPSVTEESVKALGIKAASDLNQVAGADGKYAPLSDCYALKFKEDEEFIGFGCCEFESVFAKTLKDKFGIDMYTYDIKAYSKLFKFLDSDTFDYLSETFNESQGHKMLGYPYFTQEDPRNPGENDVLLFQMDSDDTSDDISIMWGDSGVGNFFISSDALKAFDFEKATYNWDCY
ncbi:YwqG family protein [Butyrivibrio sp. VCB2006]|uniref:YwqG family protein n=1 Tax=Butyrivibrio sp. VCB2006 TaxID=1280679 RepID=UPI00040DF543|nr:YwqG family protein [Butyrivibrio sp. VCB2006]